jgi:phosphate:Na+ symporter
VAEGQSEVNGTLQALGGLGLFLFGMVILTEGLRSLAGRSLRLALCRFTRSPATGALTGAVTTAVVQSSSATTVAAVGFVGAGLITFPQSLGIIFGANIGTTITGWLVALIGFKLSLGTAVLPVVLAGALLYLFGNRRWRHIGYALAGFGLIFVGITALQAGMESLRDIVTPESFPANTTFGRLQLVAIGIGITIITQRNHHHRRARYGGWNDRRKAHWLRSRDVQHAHRCHGVLATGPVRQRRRVTDGGN